jgi:hypothetical protein
MNLKGRRYREPDSDERVGSTMKGEKDANTLPAKYVRVENKKSRKPLINTSQRNQIRHFGVSLCSIGVWLKQLKQLIAEFRSRLEPSIACVSRVMQG